MSRTPVEFAIGAQNTYSNWLAVPKGYTWWLNINDTAFSANVSVELKINDADTTYTTLRDADITAAGLYEGVKAVQDCFIRVGVDTGDYTSGTVTGNLASGLV
jgi:hypothetical protein